MSGCDVARGYRSQELRPKGSDVRQDELGDMVDKEMAATQAAIEEAVRRIDVSPHPPLPFPLLPAPDPLWHNANVEDIDVY